ncbi:MAG: NUDIX hydrolase [Thermoproteota archaeon]
MYRKRGMKSEVLASKVVYRGRLINLRLDTVRVGKKNVEREVVEHPGAAAVIPLLGHDRLLLVRQYREAVGEILLEVPAGTIRPGEGAADCAARELSEETGYSCGNMRKAFSCYLAPGYSNELLHVFLAEKLAAGKPSPERDENLRSVPVASSTAKRMIEQGKIRDAKTIAAILWFLATRR